jgi:clan AA aspartic protease (TIGR02281 family)
MENDRSTNVCVKCGGPLRATKSSSRTRNPWYGLLLLALALAAVLYFVIIKGPGGQEAIPDIARAGNTADTKPAALVSDKQPPARIPSGRTTIRTRMGEEVMRLDTAVLDGSWIALPTWGVIGGDVWRFQSPETEDIPIIRGSWIQGAPLGIWKLAEPLPGNHPPLSPWDQGAALYWQALAHGSPMNRIELDSSPQPFGAYSRLAIPEDLMRPGVFLQEDRVVGWTFGLGWDYAFLWTGPESSGLEPNIMARDLVGVAFSQSQESRFVQALKMGDVPAGLRALDLLSEGIQLYPKLAEEDKPPYLRLPSINRQLLILCRDLLKTEPPQDMAAVLESRVIRASGDPELLKIATQAQLAAYDYRRALRFFEGLKGQLSSGTEGAVSSLDTFHLELYKDWIQNDMDQELVSRGWEAFEAGRRLFPVDVELHLLGVELAIKSKEWGRAEELLKDRSFPADYKTRASNLEVILLERQSEENKIVVRFAAGAEAIPVDVLLNNRVIQRFIVDTGANVVTIPSEIVEPLGIRIDDNTPVHRVSTVSGYMLAYEVSINQMEIKGQRVHNIQALVIDMPGQPGVGLLGQSFLKHFEVEIDGKKGILRLEKR